MREKAYGGGFSNRISHFTQGSVSGIVLESFDDKLWARQAQGQGAPAKLMTSETHGGGDGIL